MHFTPQEKARIVAEYIRNQSVTRAQRCLRTQMKKNLLRATLIHIIKENETKKNFNVINLSLLHTFSISLELRLTRSINNVRLKAVFSLFIDTRKRLG